MANTEPVQGQTLPPWQYKIVPFRGVQISSLLVRITVAKIKDLASLEKTLSQVPLAQYQGFTCRTWVAGAIIALDQDGSLVTKRTGDWNAIQDFATRYVKETEDVGRWSIQGKRNPAQTATCSLIENTEIFFWVLTCYLIPPVEKAYRLLDIVVCLLLFC